MPTSLMLNAISAISIRLSVTNNGPWTADVELDPDVTLSALPPGPAVLTIGTTVLTGFIDPLAQGVFGPKASCRVVAGRGGWSKTVPAQDYANDAGVTSAEVISTTAALVGEVATVLIPTVLGVQYMRSEGPASRVLDGLAWHVDFTGTTVVGPRVPTITDPNSVIVLDYDPTQQRAIIGTDDPVVPGSVLVDLRVGTLNVVDVEQTWDSSGCKTIAWCGTSTVSRLSGALAKLAQEAVGLPYLKSYQYRVVLQGPDGRLQLQPIDILGAMPFTLPVLGWTGMSGVTAKLTPASQVLLSFPSGDPTKPLVVAYDSATLPLELTADAVTAAHLAPTALSVDVGAGALSVALAGGAQPLATGEWATVLTAALLTFASALTSDVVDPVLASAATALVAALQPKPSGPLPLPTTLKVTGT